MSRTLAHAPLWTRTDYRIAVHDHRFGACDLPDHPLAALSGEPTSTRCYWGHDWSAMPPICSCELCHAGRLKRADRRADRHRARSVLRVRGRVASAIEDLKI